MHWTGHDAERWLQQQRETGSHIVGVELAEEAIALADLPAARQRTVAVLGHEQSGIPPHALDLVDVFVEIPMVGIGASRSFMICSVSAAGCQIGRCEIPFLEQSTGTEG